MTADKPKRKVIQIRTTDEFEHYLDALSTSTGLRKKSAVIFFAVKELFDQRCGPKPD